MARCKSKSKSKGRLILIVVLATICIVGNVLLAVLSIKKEQRKDDDISSQSVSFSSTKKLATKDVPLVMQSSPRDCGLAVLSMMFKHLGKDMSIEQIRSDFNIDTTNGMNGKQLIEISQQCGFDAKGYKCSVDDLKELEVPFIIHWNNNHFVVLTGLTEDKAFINDPARGSVEVDMDEFEESFTGIVFYISQK